MATTTTEILGRSVADWAEVGSSSAFADFKNGNAGTWSPIDVAAYHDEDLAAEGDRRDECEAALLRGYAAEAAEYGWVEEGVVLSRARAPAKGVVLLVTDEDGARLEDAEDFLRANAHDDEVLDAVASLAEGATVEFGGGAAPLTTVRREDRSCVLCGGRVRPEAAGLEAPDYCDDPRCEHVEDVDDRGD